MRGRGLSDKPPTGYNLEQHCRDIEAVLDDLKIDRVVAMGHSLGAYITLALAAGRPARVDRLVLIDGGARMQPEDWAKVTTAIKPSLDRLEADFPTFEEYLAPLKAASFFQPWNKALDEYFDYEAEEVNGRWRSRIRAEHMREEAAGLTVMDTGVFFPRVRCPVLILRATQGILSSDDLLISKSSAAEMLEALPGSRLVNVDGTNHYSIMFQANDARDRAVLDFLE